MDYHKQYVLCSPTLKRPEFTRLVVYDLEMNPHYLIGKEYNALKKQGIIEEMFWVKEGPYWDGLLECHLIKHSAEKEKLAFWEKRITYRTEYGALYGSAFQTPVALEDAVYEEWLRKQKEKLEPEDIYYNFFNIFYSMKNVISDVLIGVMPLFGKEPYTPRIQALYKPPYEGVSEYPISLSANRIEATIKVNGKKYELSSTNIAEIYRESKKLLRN